MKLIIHQKYRNIENNNIYNIVSIKGNDIVVKAQNGSSIEVFEQKEFEKSFKEAFYYNNRVLHTKQGNVYIKVTFRDIVEKLRGPGICDRCNGPAIFVASKDTANLIPVLNMVFCDDCFTNWENEAVYFSEDEKYEKEKTDRYLSILN